MKAVTDVREGIRVLFGALVLVIAVLVASADAQYRETPSDEAEEPGGFEDLDELEGKGTAYGNMYGTGGGGYDGEAPYDEGGDVYPGSGSHRAAPPPPLPLPSVRKGVRLPPAVDERPWYERLNAKPDPGFE